MYSRTVGFKISKNMDIPEKHILIVEDDTLLIEEMKQLFAEHCFKVTVALDGESGLERALAEQPDITLLDIMIPKLNGVDFLRRLHDDPWGKTAAVIVLTNLDNSMQLAEVLELGKYDYLLKADWSLDALLQKVNARLTNKA